MDRSSYLGGSKIQARGRVLVASGAPAVDSISEWPNLQQQQLQSSPDDDNGDGGLNYRKELEAAIVAVTRHVNPSQKPPPTTLPSIAFFTA